MGRAVVLAGRDRHGNELAALLHRGDHVLRAQDHLRGMVAGLVREAVDAGKVRGDVEPVELATYCLHALTAAGALGSDAAINTLVDVTLAGRRP